MPEVSKSFHSNEVEVSISEVIDGIYRIAGFVETYGITFNQFLIQDENPFGIMKFSKPVNVLLDLS
jgi:hypothetical protein